MFKAGLPMISFPESGLSQAVIEPHLDCALNVLVLDNDPMTIDFLDSFLSSYKCHLIRAKSLNDAIEKCKTLKISLVVSEFLLGDHTCIEIIMMLRKMYPLLPIAVMSAQQDLISEKDALNFSANYFLNKPIQPDKMRNIILNCTHQLSKFS
jgi:two-component system, NtrC family, response regulator PilR